MYLRPFAFVAAMSASKWVKLPRTNFLLMNDVNGKSPPLQNAAEYWCWEILAVDMGICA